MFMMDIDKKYIDAKPMKNIMEDEMIRAHQVLLKRRTEIRTCSQKTHTLDNEASDYFKRVIKKTLKIATSHEH